MNFKDEIHLMPGMRMLFVLSESYFVGAIIAKLYVFLYVREDVIAF